MACERCFKEGRHKVIHFERCGRWESRIFCEHTYKRARLDKKEIGHEESKTKIRRRPTKNADRIKYLPEMDQFILARYGSKGRWVRTASYGKGEMKLLAEAFSEKFAIANVRPNQLIGRWNRLRNWERERLEREATQRPAVGIPSLPVLRFLQDRAGHQ